MVAYFYWNSTLYLRNKLQKRLHGHTIIVGFFQRFSHQNLILSHFSNSRYSRLSTRVTLSYAPQKEEQAKNCIKKFVSRNICLVSLLYLMSGLVHVGSGVHVHGFSRFTRTHKKTLCHLKVEKNAIQSSAKVLSGIERATIGINYNQWY